MLMITTFLTLHLVMAILYVLALIVITLTSIARTAMPAIIKAAYVSFGTIIVSGIGLVSLSPKAITQFCISALIASAIGVVVSQVYKRRVIAFHTMQNELY